MGIESLVRRCVDVFQSAFKKSQKPRKRIVHRPRVHIEDLEIRCFLSATAGLATIIQPDSKTLVIGSSTDLSTGNDDIDIVRQPPNGSLDPSFGTFETDGLAFFPVDLTGDGADVAYAVAIDPDTNDIVVAGTAATDDEGVSSAAVIRWKFNGHLDTLFADGGLATIDFENPAPPG